MRELTDELWSGSYTYKDIGEVLDEQLPANNITDGEWQEYLSRRRPIEQSLVQVGVHGISLKDLADYHGISQDELLTLLRIIGPVKGEDGRFRISHKPPPDRSWTLLDDRSPLQRAGAAGLTLEKVAICLGCSSEEALERLKVEGAVKGEDGRFRLPIKRPR